MTRCIDIISNGMNYYLQCSVHLEVLGCVGRRCMSSEVLGALLGIVSLSRLLGVGLDTLQSPTFHLLCIVCKFMCVNVNVDN